jgi:hypothetical protein
MICRILICEKAVHARKQEKTKFEAANEERIKPA